MASEPGADDGGDEYLDTGLLYCPKHGHIVYPFGPVGMAFTEAVPNPTPGNECEQVPLLYRQSGRSDG
jgi:hypothetical protein